MKLAPDTHKVLQDFFRDYFVDEGFRLPKIEVYGKRLSGAITKILGVGGITIGSRILIDPEIIKKDSENLLRMNKNLLAHEITHVIQYRDLGFFRFLFDYLREYFVNLRKKENWGFRSRMEAYWEISHEVEARRAGEEFEKWYADK